MLRRRQLVDKKSIFRSMFTRIHAPETKMWNTQSLYKLAIQALAESDHLNDFCLECLPGLVKEDILNAALQRGKNNVQISKLLHPDIRVLRTQGSKILIKDFAAISKCQQISILEMNPPAGKRFDHASHLLSGMLSQLRCLVKLQLQRNNGVTDDVIITVVNTCSPTLQELDVSGCWELTDRAVMSIATLPVLKALDISESLVTREGLMYIAKGRCALSLTELNINICKKIDRSSCRSITDDCSNLRILGLNIISGGFAELPELDFLRGRCLNKIRKISF